MSRFWLARQTLADLVALCPEFEGTWEQERYLWTDDQGCFSAHGVFNAFTTFTVGRLRSYPVPEIRNVFDYVESLLTDDDSEAGNAASTCFLENLLNVTPEQLDPSTFVPLLGPRSRRFCRGWDRWCGVKTRGLW